MTAAATECPACRSGVPAGARECPRCGAALGPAAPRDGGLSPDLSRRFLKLRQWAEIVEPLGITLPVLPAWAEEAARGGADPDRWSEVLRGIERLSQNQIVAALEEWQRGIRTRLTRLEAYAVDSRLERDQMDDALHFAKIGEIGRALTAYQQVDRVIALKERHLDTAREELESVISLLRDMSGLGLPVPSDPDELGRELERELRSGRLAALKQQLRTLRSRALEDGKRTLPEFVTRYGTLLQSQRGQGALVESEIAELGRGARLLARGRNEEAIHRLRKLVQVHGPGTGRPAGARGADGDSVPAATAASRRT